MMKRILSALVLTLIATAVLLPNAACRRFMEEKEAATGIPAIENVGQLDVLL